MKIVMLIGGGIVMVAFTLIIAYLELPQLPAAASVGFGLFWIAAAEVFEEK